MVVFETIFARAGPIGCMTAMLQSGLNIACVITHRFPYAQYPEGFELMRLGQSGKVVLC